jgi:acetolactate synthase-1/2/3 large subunit
MNVSEYIFNFFAEKGINTVFMVTGGQAMYLDDAVGKSGKFEIICTHHEQAAAMAADAYGRIKNKPAIALVTAGPGSVNAMNGVVGGYTDSSPMIVVSGQANFSFVKYQEETRIRQYGVQGINIKPLVESVVKYFITIDEIKKLDHYLNTALINATSGRPGPVWIDVPLDIQRQEVDVALVDPFYDGAIKRNINNNRYYEQILERLLNSKRPVFLVGQGIALASARDNFKHLLDLMPIPVITSRLGIDLIESDSRLYVGRPGNYGERSANFAIQNADLIITIGCRLASSLVGHDPGGFGRLAYKIVVDIDEKELNKPGVKIDSKICMDCKEFIVGLSEHLENRFDIKAIPDFSKWITVCNNWKNNYPVVQPEYLHEKPINSYVFIDKLSSLAPKDAYILVDTGSCFHVACQTWKIKKGQRYLTTGGLSSMGYWVAGIGACLANNKNDTIVITGDGSLQMNLQEFATIKHNKLPLKIFILNNNGYLLIRHTQRNFMDDRFIGESPETGVWCPDILEVAKAYGIKALRISGIEEAEEKIRETLSYDGPVVCDVMTPEWQLLIPRVSSDKLPDGTLVSREYSDMFPYLSRDEYQKNMLE